MFSGGWVCVPHRDRLRALHLFARVYLQWRGAISDVATRIACELDEFIAEHRNPRPIYGPHEKWVLADQDITVTLTLATDNSGYVNFTGVNVAKLGLGALARLISSQSSVPSLAAKVSIKTSKSAAIKFTVSPKDLTADKQELAKCTRWIQTENILTRLYLRDWLNHYFETINNGISQYNPKNNPTPDLADELLHAAPPTNFLIRPIPSDFKMVSVDLTTQFFIAADISGGATPNLLGNGSVFVLPVNGVSADYNPDYSHKVDIVMNVCNNTPTIDAFTGKRNNNPCYASDDQRPPDKVTALLKRQCEIYAWLRPLLTGVTPPQDVKLSNGQKERCNSKTGSYEIEIAPPPPPLPVHP